MNMSPRVNLGLQKAMDMDERIYNMCTLYDFFMHFNAECEYLFILWHQLKIC